ncbi:hypothetical protein ElyMa_005256200 [Elysia marginata]|uniref:Uncharacterized protein n=1 Tax=Elysia marginata TaxID=1093978 RepID=A0AAV4K0M4_9GAST|nr:hypothetical protein ElyMa_005256200 [Elysia marginata]
MLSFDICKFYHSVAKEKHYKSLLFAWDYVTISEDEVDIIAHTKRARYDKEEQQWCNTNTNYNVANSNLELTIESFDGAETCELAGLYLLFQLQLLDFEVRLYRDGGLAMTNKSPQQKRRDKETNVHHIQR